MRDSGCLPAVAIYLRRARAGRAGHLRAAIGDAARNVEMRRRLRRGSGTEKRCKNCMPHTMIQDRILFPETQIPREWFGMALLLRSKKSGVYRKLQRSRYRGINTEISLPNSAARKYTSGRTGDQSPSAQRMRYSAVATAKRAGKLVAFNS